MIGRGMMLYWCVERGAICQLQAALALTDQSHRMEQWHMSSGWYHLSLTGVMWGYKAVHHSCRLSVVTHHVYAVMLDVISF
jgi:hypothetical protein